jgi:hypothetical protein
MRHKIIFKGPTRINRAIGILAEFLGSANSSQTLAGSEAD